MRRILVASLLVMVVIVSCAPLSTPAIAPGATVAAAAESSPSQTLPSLAMPAPTPGPAVTSTLASTMTPDTLRAHAQRGDFFIGSAMSYYVLGRGNPRQYVDTLTREFNMLTVENEIKFANVHPERDRYDFAPADWVVNLAEKNGLAARGHTLVWHQLFPPWLVEGEWTRDEMIEILRDHIHTVVGHYRGRLVAWDVVNEGIWWDGTLWDSIWLQTIGPDYIEMAFRWAHEADPDVLLFYNDHGGEGLGPKSDAIYNLVKDLKERGVPIHGVGLQMHLVVDRYPDPQDVASNMRRYEELGLQIHITEMDVAIDVPVTQGKLEQQAIVYRQMLEVCLEAPNCTAFVLWGYADRQSWVPDYFEGYDAATIFDKAYRPKPSYYAIKEVLSSFFPPPTPGP